MPKKNLTIGRAKGNIMPVSWSGVDFKIPLSRRFYGVLCKETSFSPSRSTAIKRRDNLRKEGFNAYMKSFTATASAKGFPRYTQTLHVVYRGGRGKKVKHYGSGKFSKTGKIHKTKASADKVAKSCKAVGIAYRIVKLKNGYRVDKKF